MKKFLALALTIFTFEAHRISIETKFQVLYIQV